MFRPNTRTSTFGPPTAKINSALSGNVLTLASLDLSQNGMKGQNTRHAATRNTVPNFSMLNAPKDTRVAC